MPTNAIAPRQKPFANYKWRWAVLTPTESLNSPPVFLGVLRVFRQFDGQPPGSPEIRGGLKVVQRETNSRVDLVRTPERNLVRNSGQYWKALGLIEEAHGLVRVSPFGKLLADGHITQVEFATTVVKTLELPNRRIQDDVADWVRAGLQIKPLELILHVLSVLARQIGDTAAYITPRELTGILIPLAGAKVRPSRIAEALQEYRLGQLDITGWPDCVPSSNDKRMAREFLIFLANYGFCARESAEEGNDNERYVLASISREEAVQLQTLRMESEDLEDAVAVIRDTQIPANIERKRVSREVLERPHQVVFRRNVLAAFRSTCLLTGVDLDNVLEAAHIVPIRASGSDDVANGLCLRSDVHQLFDSGHLRLQPTGDVILSDVARADQNYATLPRRVDVPRFVSREHLGWRVKYY
jgi:hypothetical protein